MKKLIKYLMVGFVYLIIFGIILVVPAYLLIHYTTKAYYLNTILGFMYLMFAVFILIKFNFFNKEIELKEELTEGQRKFLKSSKVAFFILASLYFVYTKEYLYTILILALLLFMFIDKDSGDKKSKGHVIHVS